MLRERINRGGSSRLPWKLEHVRLDGVLCILFIFPAPDSLAVGRGGGQGERDLLAIHCIRARRGGRGEEGKKNPGYEPIWTLANYFYRRCVPACYAPSTVTGGVVKPNVTTFLVFNSGLKGRGAIRYEIYERHKPADVVPRAHNARPFKRYQGHSCVRRLKTPQGPPTNWESGFQRLTHRAASNG